MKHVSGSSYPRRVLAALAAWWSGRRRTAHADGRAHLDSGGGTQAPVVGGRFEDLAEALPQIVVVLRPDGVAEYVNARWETYSGSRAAFAVDDRRLVEPEDQARVADTWREATAAGESCGFDLRLRRHDGAYRWFHASLEPVRGADGRIARWCGTLVDVDQARREAIRDGLLSRVLLRLVAAADPRDMAREIFQTIAADMQLDGYLNYDLDAGSGTMRLASCAGIDDDGLAEARSIPVGRYLCGRVAQTGEPLYLPHVAASRIDDARLVRRQGFRVYFCTPLVVGGTLLGTLSFGSRRRETLDEDDIEFLRTLATYLAIAKDRATTAEALRRSEQALRLALDTAKLGTWSYDVSTDEFGGDRRAAEILGLPVDASPLSLTNGIVPIIVPADAARVRAALAAAVDPAGEGRFEARCAIARANEPARRHIEALGRTVYEGQGEARRALRIFGSLLDVTGRVFAEGERESLLASERHARHEAERAGRLKDEFLATLSHELRTPLNAVLGWTQVLRMKHGHEGALDDGLAVIERNARAQAQIIEDLLDMSRITSGKVRIAPQPVEVASLVERALETMRPAAEAKRVAMLFDRTGDGLFVNGDASRLQQVMWNLLSNAVKFTPSGGSVRIDVREEGDAIEIAVADTGAGIDSRFLPHLFERFRQADGSTTRQFGGLGLGLALVKQLVEMHGGTVRAASAGRDRGATFTVRLPALRSSGTTTPSTAPGVAWEDTASHRRGDLAGARVLVVEDDADAREFTARLLREWGATVDSVGSASEALAAVERAPPHLLVSDVGMPEEDGYVLMRRVRALGLHEGKRLPAVALTAYARAEDRLKALQAGFDMHVPKPVEPAELLAVCSTLLARSDRAPATH